VTACPRIESTKAAGVGFTSPLGVVQLATQKLAEASYPQLFRLSSSVQVTKQISISEPYALVMEVKRMTTIMNYSVVVIISFCLFLWL